MCEKIFGHQQEEGVVIVISCICTIIHLTVAANEITQCVLLKD